MHQVAHRGVVLFETTTLNIWEVKLQEVLRCFPLLFPKIEQGIRKNRKRKQTKNCWFCCSAQICSESRNSCNIHIYVILNIFAESLLFIK